MFSKPLWLLLLIPGIILALIPYFRLNKQNRRTANRLISMAIHIVSLTLIIFLLAGFSLIKYDSHVKDEVFILIDESDSMTKSNIVEDKLTVLLEELNDYKVGLILFAQDAHIVSALTNDKQKLLRDYQTHQAKSPFASNIEKALLLASDNFSNPSRGRVIIITDGLETDGNALVAVQNMQSMGTTIDVIYINSPLYEGEVAVIDVAIPKSVSKGDRTIISVTTKTDTPQNVFIKLYENEVEIETLSSNILLNGGEETISFEHTFLKSGLSTIKVEVLSNSDTIKENNTFYAYANVDGVSNRVLIIEGDNENSTALEQILKTEFDVDAVTISNVENEMIYGYDAIILKNVSNASMPTNFDEALNHYIHKLGGSLLTIGGSDAYQQADMENTLFEQMLPVFSSTQSKSMAVILVIDKSGSMITHGSEKLELAKQGAIETLYALKDDDYIGIVLFDANPVVLVEPTPVSQKADIIPLIESISAGAGTRYTGGLQLAKNQLDNFPGNQNFNKHVIFLTDGAPQDDGYNAVIQQYGPISLSTIAIGNDHGIDYDIVMNMVRVVEDRGQYYQVVDEYELPEIMKQEAESISSDYLNEERFSPTFQTKTPGTAHLLDVPDLLGYYGSRIKENATVILAKDSDPIYAIWNYGQGKSASFLSDLNGHYSSEFIDDQRGKLFILSILKELLPVDFINSYDVLARFNKDNLLANVSVTSYFSEQDQLKLALLTPDGQRIQLDAVKQSEQTYLSQFELLTSGVYTLISTKLNHLGDVISESHDYITHSYSDEYIAFYDDYAVFQSLKQLSEAGGGDVLFDLEGIFDETAQTKTIEINVTLSLLIMTMALFLIDIITRKFKFKKPNEWFIKK